MKPLKVAFLWHQHQPYYRLKQKFILPWVRFHGAKDYFDLPDILHEFPEIKQNFNFVPSLNIQLNEYISGEVQDEVQELTKLRADELDREQKQQILKLFFLCNKEHLIDPHPRYKELYDLSRDIDYALQNFTSGDWRDIQVWYNLTWFGYFSSKSNRIKRLFNKGKNYTEKEKILVLELQLEILKKIIPQLKDLQDLDQIEISVSAMYHPILPLLVDSNSAKEAQPNTIMPDPVYKYPEDAQFQISEANNYYNEIFGKKSLGMWSPEGSISDDILEMLAENGVQWTASDEMILANSSSNYHHLDKFFPRKFEKNGKEITLFLRDHSLSDKIGFEYSRWNPWDAANDFTHHLHNIRNDIIDHFGENALKYAVVPVILDGENCWEYYKENGVPFLRELFSRLTADDLLKTVTFEEALEDNANEYLETINHITAGSWINANFNIWIGDVEDITAWNFLSKARQHLEKKKDDISEENYLEAMKHVYIAEGSDWFWWYGPEHSSENKPDFDRIFRWHLEEIYRLTGEEFPEELHKPVYEHKTERIKETPQGVINPEVTGDIETPGWDKAGKISLAQQASTMHQAGDILSSFYYGTDNDNVFIRIVLNQKFSDKDTIRIELSGNNKLSFFINNAGLKLNSQKQERLSNFEYAFGNCVDLSFPKELLGYYEDIKGKNPELTLISKFKNKEINYPVNDKYKLNF